MDDAETHPLPRLLVCCLLRALPYDGQVSRHPLKTPLLLVLDSVAQISRNRGPKEKASCWARGRSSGRVASGGTWAPSSGWHLTCPKVAAGNARPCLHGTPRGPILQHAVTHILKHQNIKPGTDEKGTIKN